MSRLKILIFLEGEPSPIGGIERHCFNLIELLEKSGFEVSVLTGKDVKHKYLKKINKILFNKRDLQTKIENINPDIVHVHGFASLVVPQVINCAYKLKKRIIYTAHFHPFNTLNNPLLGRFFFNFFLKNCLQKIETIITINKDDTTFFNKYSKDIVMIPHWLNNHTEVSSKQRDPKLVLFVGRFESNKGIEHLLALPTKKYEIHCVSKGNIIRSDFIQHKNISDIELNSLYMRASVVIIPSRYEAFSYAALEALSSGCPIVLSDRVRIADYLKPLIGNGVEIFKYGDFESFQAKIDKCIVESVDINLIKQIFNTKKIKEKYKQIYINN